VFVLEITHEVGMSTFLAILPFKSRGKTFNFGDFRVLGVLEVEAQDLRFLLFKRVLGLEIQVRDHP
jgi:hypothetical protein